MKSSAMKTNLILVVIAVCISSLIALTGCATTTAADNEQAQNRQYMSSVNQIMDEINAEMEEFAAAVKDGEVISLSTQQAAVSNSVDRLKALEVPDAMKDIQSSYLNGVEELQNAFDAYVSLYEDVKAPASGSFDYSTYDSRLAEVRSHYDAGIKALEDADQKASEA